MKTVLIAAFLSALCSEPSIAVKDTKLCLTWNATDASLFLKCKVLRLDYKLVLMDAFNIIRVECFKNRTPFCATSREDDMFFVNLTDGFSLVLQTDKKNGDGNWQCIHGHNEDHVNISSSKGTIYSTDLHLSGEIIETKEYKKFNLTCFSCWIPHMRSVYFFVNGVLEDNLQVSGGKCYNKREMCNLTECTCSMEGNDFTWSYTSDLSYLEFSCEMRFKDLETLQLSFETAHLIYYETVNEMDCSTGDNCHKTPDFIKSLFDEDSGLGMDFTDFDDSPSLRLLKSDFSSKRKRDEKLDTNTDCNTPVSYSKRRYIRSQKLLLKKSLSFDAQILSTSKDLSVDAIKHNDTITEDVLVQGAVLTGDGKEECCLPTVQGHCHDLRYITPKHHESCFKREIRAYNWQLSYNRQ